MKRRGLKNLNVVQASSIPEQENNGQQAENESLRGKNGYYDDLNAVDRAGNRKVRGRTVLKDIYTLAPEDHIFVSSNDEGQSIGPEGRALSSFLGMVARNGKLLPIDVETWHRMSNGNKEAAFDFVKKRFILEVSKDYVLQSLGTKWRNFKARLNKKNFKREVDIKVALRHIPIGVQPYQYNELLKFWYSEKGEGKEQIGIESRKHQTSTHTAGSKSFARLSHEEEVKTGRKLTRLEIYELTHTKKDGAPLTRETAEKLNKAKEKMMEYEAAASTVDSVNMFEIENRVISEVFGPERYGRVRFKGSGVNPSQYFGSSSQKYTSSLRQTSQAEVSRLKEQVAHIEETTREKIARMEAAEAAREAAMKKMQDDREEEKRRENITR